MKQSAIRCLKTALVCAAVHFSIGWVCALGCDASSPPRFEPTTPRLGGEVRQTDCHGKDMAAMLANIRGSTEQLRRWLERLRRKGIDIAYPLVDVTILEQYDDFAEEDLAAGKRARACMTLEELEVIQRVCRRELKRLAANRLNPPVPRYVTSPITIDGPNLRATVRWHDGGESRDWPVIFNGYGAFDSVKRDIELMQDYGMNRIQIEIGPNFILVSENEKDYTAIRELKAVLDRAAAAHISVDLLLSPHYFPQWAYDKWPEIHIKAGEYIPFSVDSSHVRTVLEDYLDTLISEIRDHPALVSLCLTNEPSYFDPSRDVENRSRYNSWLKQTYGSIDAVADTHGEDYQSYDSVPMFWLRQGQVYPVGITNPVARYDYFRFNDKRFSEFHQWMADTVHAMAPDVPVHAKIADYIAFDPFDGIEPDQFMDLSQVAGNDSGNLYYGHLPDEPYDNGWIFQNIYFDILRSLSGKPLINSESHIIRDHEGDTMIPRSHIRSAMWQAALHGQSGSTVWVWERDGQNEQTGDPDPDFTSIMQSPRLVKAHGRISLDLLRLGPEITALRDKPARVAMLYSSTSAFYNHEDFERTSHFLYEALSFSGEKVDFVGDKQLARGKVPQYEVLFVGGVTHLPADAYPQLESYRSSGGRIVRVGEKQQNLRYDHLNRPVAYDFSDTDLFTDNSPEELRSEIIPLLKKLPGGRPVRLRSVDTGKEAWGIDWRYSTHEGKELISLCNYTHYPLTFTIRGIGRGRRWDLLNMKSENNRGPITLDSLEVKLIEVSPRPLIPIAPPEGRARGRTGVKFRFRCSVDDPGLDHLQCRFDWGDGSRSRWSSGPSISHMWSKPGAYCVKGQAKDSHKACSRWSDCATITIR